MRAEREIRLALFAGTPHDCPYLAGRHSVLHYVDPNTSVSPALFGALLKQGFRRSGNFVYRPGCPQCNRCVSLRIPAATFAPDRSQRRTARRNADITVDAGPASLTDAHFTLYRRYVNTRHGDGSMANPGRASTREFLTAAWCETLFLDLRLAGRLVATAVTDVLPDGLSAVYTFFDPDLAKRGLGTYALLSQVAHATQLGLRHLYLGYWVPGSRKMEYKERFRPLELYLDGRWKKYGYGATLPVPR